MQKPTSPISMPRILRPSVLMATLTLLMVSGVRAQEIIVSALSSAPSTPCLANSHYLDTSSGTDGVQARMTSGSDWKGVYQAFTWTTDRPLANAGFLVSPSFNPTVNSLYAYIVDQTWALDVFELRTAKNGNITRKILTKVFTVPASAVVAGKYLNLAFGTPVPLKNGFTYAIDLYPTQIVNQRVLFALSTIKGRFGGGGQSAAGKSTAFNFPAATSDLTFYVTTGSSIPDPSTISVSAK